MAKISPRAVEGYLKQPDPAHGAALIYGPDAGLVRERAQMLGRAIVADLNDPFNVIEIDPGRLGDQPGLIAESLAAQSLMGGRQLIRMRDGAEAAAAQIARALEVAEPGGNFLLVEAGDLGPRSALRTAFEKAGHAGTIACYVEDARDLAVFVRQHLQSLGFSASEDAVSYLATSLTGDRGQARAELDKLALYMAEPGEGSAHLTPPRIGLEEAQAVGGDAAARDLDDFVLAVAEGDGITAMTSFDRLVAEGTSAVALLRALLRHFDRLRVSRMLVEEGASRADAIGSLRPPVFWKLKDRFAAQLGRWSLAALEGAIDRVMEAEMKVKTTGMPAETLVGQTALILALQAGRRG